MNPPCPRDEWLNDYRIDARHFAQNRLSHPVLKPFRDGLANFGVARAIEIGKWLRDFDEYFPERNQFIRWYNLVSYRESLRAILEVETVEASVVSLVALQPESRSLFRWSYVDQLVENDIAFMLARTVEQRLNLDYRTAQAQMIDAYLDLCKTIRRRYRSLEEDYADRYLDCTWVFPRPPTLSAGLTAVLDKGDQP